MSITHSFTSAKSDGGDATLVRPGDWNAVHSVGAYLGYNTIGGSVENMTQHRLVAKQVTASSNTNVLLGIEAHIAVTTEAVMTWAVALFEDSGSDTIGDMISMLTYPVGTQGYAAALIHATGNYPYRWYGLPMTRLLAASTKYWVGISWLDGNGAPAIHYDTSGSDRYYASGATPYIGDGTYTAFTQTNSTRKYSIRALVL